MDNEILSKLYKTYEEWDICGLHDSIIEKAHELLRDKEKFINASPDELLYILVCAELVIDNYYHKKNQDKM